jgi:hypothetical protein
MASSLRIPAGWVQYEPDVVAAAGTFTTVAAVGMYAKRRNLIHCCINILITTNGTAATNIQAGLPFTATSTFMRYMGCGNNGTGSVLAFVNPLATRIIIYQYNFNYPGGDGESVRVSVTYEGA